MHDIGNGVVLADGLIDRTDQGMIAIGLSELSQVSPTTGLKSSFPPPKESNAAVESETVRINTENPVG